MKISLVFVIVFALLAGFVALRLTILFEDRLPRYRKNLFIVMALIIFVVVLKEIVWSPLGLLAIPIFLFGGFYAFYDAFIRTPESDRS